MPVAEVGVAAVIDEVAAPAALNVADQPGVDDLLHLQDHRKITHVVAHEKLRAGPHCGFENAVAPLERDRQRLFEVDGLARFERGDRHLLVQEIRRHDEDHADFRIVQEFPVVAGHGGVRKRLLKLPARLFSRVGPHGDDPAVFRLMGAARVFAAAAGSDDSDFLRFHKITLPVCGLHLSLLCVNLNGNTTVQADFS